MKRIRSFIIAVSMTCSLNVLANPMQDVFNGYSTGHGVVDYETSNKKAIALGSFSYRVKSHDPNIVNFQGPSMKAGCNGIDLNLGSFSMIKDLTGMLQNSMRQIAAGSASYAFNLALDALCPTCAANIKSLKKAMDEWNQFFKNSCEAGQALMANAVGPYEQSIKDTLAIGQAANSTGVATDSADWFQNMVPGTSLLELSQKVQNGQELLTGNLLINGMRTSKMNVGAADFFPRFSETVMSLVGTEIRDVADNTNPDAQGVETSSIATTPVPPTLTLLDISFGGFDTSDQVTRLKCDDGNPDTVASSKCLNISQETIDWQPLNVQFLEALDGTTDGTSGVLEVYRTGARGSSDFGPTQKSIIQGGGMDVYGYIELLATKYRKSDEVKGYYEAIANEYSYNFAMQFYASARSYLDAVAIAAKADSDANAQAYIKEARERLNSQMDIVERYYEQQDSRTRLNMLVDKSMEN
ncbi:conjugal transfer protein TraH [Vibrio splendidus]|uniref:conjugal transfer protein TraH n=1 Tax=Vibrio splendidus TaxID=29497 RepID=UPI0024694703|nr:conjugal transfer protein TraH [Vibrio splendidus]MDH5938886.1 conjugal transfer protein TraH [Vibrio splendidus]